ncbi:MAG: hypothetical protein KAT68_11530 [Bacteroidales bacterium]|nr:hypothetical protein [Bacteroidales bacterium]
MLKEKYQLEYTINSSPNVLYNRISSPGGLSEWFANDVNVKDDIYTFIWDNSEQKARLINKKEQKYAKFHWLDDEDENTYFEFKLNTDELTGDIALIITDFAEADEKKDSIDLWDAQINDLKHILGL